MTTHDRGDHVAVKHGATSWLGIVTASQPGHITVSYPGGSQPFDGKPSREMIDLTKHHVERATR